MRIVLAGIMGRYPYGGVAWCALMYLLGLRKLGHEVWYFEDTGEANFDPERNTMAHQPSYALRFIDRTLRRHGLEDRWWYVDLYGQRHGPAASRWREICADADLYLNLSGGSWFWRDEYASIPHSAFIDSDPVFTQLAISGAVPWYVDFFHRFGALFTFGRNVGTDACPVPTGPFTWHHTWQPVDMDEWRPTAETPRDTFTTIMTWRIGSFQEIGGNKDKEFLRVLDLPRATSVPLELAIERAHELLRARGWRTTDSFIASRDPRRYRDYIRSSKGEFSLAKHTYVRWNSGWFSDRTECYLASGRPAVVQDTGFSAHLPVGEGLIPFRDLAEARAGLEAVVADYDRHSTGARDVAGAHFASGIVLPPLLERATARPSRAGGLVREPTEVQR